jgi:hypothetical protein
MRKIAIVLLLVVMSSGCGIDLIMNMHYNGGTDVTIKQAIFEKKYNTVRKIILDAAAENGFSQLTSEIKPSAHNDWKGKIYFALKTLSGTDQLEVEFTRKDNLMSIHMFGCGTRSNPDSAIKEIETRLRTL